jgi:hypothetical protein
MALTAAPLPPPLCKTLFAAGFDRAVDLSPVLPGAGELAPCAGGIEVRRITGEDRERLRVRLPLLAALGNGPVSALRAVTLSARMAASKRDAEGRPFPALLPSTGRRSRTPLKRSVPAGKGGARPAVSSPPAAAWPKASPKYGRDTCRSGNDEYSFCSPRERRTGINIGKRGTLCGLSRSSLSALNARGFGTALIVLNRRLSYE